MYKCDRCDSRFGIKPLIIHLKNYHGISTKSKFTCQISFCQQIFTDINRFKKHLCRTHSNVDDVDLYIRNEYLIDNNLNVPNISTNNFDQLHVSNFQSSANFLSKTNKTNRIHNAALVFLSNLHKEEKFCRDKIFDIIKSFKTILLPEIVNELDKTISPILAQEHKNEFDLLIKRFSNPFDNIDTEHKYIKTLLERNLFQYPKEIHINNEIGSITDNYNPNLDIKISKGCIMPIKFHIKSFFELPNILDQTLKNMDEIKQCSEIKNFINGKIWLKKIQNYSKNDIVIPMFLYLDSFEINNPLGSHAGQQSLTGVYYSFPTIPSHCLSSLQNIFVAMIFKSRDNKKFGNDSCLYNLVNELTDLATTGLEIITSNKVHKVFIVLGLVLGDNLGLNTNLGFSKSFSSNYYCRFCKTHKSYASKNINIDDKLYRTIDNYKTDLEMNDCSLTGLNENSIFNNIPFFHVVENYSVDIMHDVFEGVFHYNICEVINYFVFEKKIFSLDTLNSRKNLFQYGELEVGYIAGNITKDHILRKRLNMSARETINFIHHFGFFIGDLVPQNNEVWSFYLKMLTFLDLILLPSFDNDLIELLRVTICEMNSLYLTLFNQSLKPKHHFLCHYYKIIYESGPIKFLSCMRYEAKHRELKMYTNNINSRRNITWSLGIKINLVYSHRLLECLGFDKLLSYSKNHKIVWKDYIHYDDLRDMCDLETNSFLYTTHHINYKNTSFKKSFFLNLIGDTNVDPLRVFSIHDFLITKKEIAYVVCFEYEILCLNTHFGGYELGDRSNRPQIFNINIFKSRPVHLCVTSNLKKLIRLKQY